MNTISVDISESLFGDTGHFLTQLTGIGDLVSIFLTNSIAIAGVVFLFLLILGGFQMISSAGKGNPQQFARGREIIVAAIIGFILVVISYWIVRLVGTATGTDLLS